MATYSKHDRRRSMTALRWPLGLTRLGMVAERLVDAMWPLFSVVLLVLAALMLGLHDLVSIEVVWGFAVVAALGAGAALIHALRRFRLPSRADALDRLDATLPGRPIRALLDDAAIGQSDSASMAVWRAHQARMADRASTAKPVPADINTAPKDPYALRYVAILAMAVAVLFGSLWRVGSVSDLAPGSGEALANGPVWEGWVEPPRYTGLPTLYLNDLDAGALDVPLGSLITVRLYGEVGALTLAETVSARTGDIPAASASAQDFVVRQSGQLEIAGPGGRIWEIAVLPDQAPIVQLEPGIETAALGETTIPFSARDDYGVSAGEFKASLDLAAVDRRYGLEIAPEMRPELIVPLPIPIAGNREDFQEALIEDFSKHPWANLPVTVRLSVLDAAEQQGLSDEAPMVLPGRRFFDPLAAALVEMRRDILWNRLNTARSAQILRTASHRPRDIFRKETTALELRRLIKRMETLASYDLSDETQNELAEELWDLALTIEEGDLADARARMERARERLEEAMRNGASDEEIAELMQELRQATEDYLNQMRRQAELDRDQSGEQQEGANENSMTLTQDDIQRMMDRIQELMEQGRMAEAEQALQELQEMLDNMRMSQQSQQGGGQNPGQEAMEGLAETLREQQGLSDQAFRDLQEQFNPNAQAGDQAGNEGRNGNQGQGQSHEGQDGQGQGSGEGQQGQQGQSGEQGDGSMADSLAQRQRDLRNELRRQQRNLPGQGTPEGDAARDALDRAGRAMENAEQDLRNDDYAGAIDNQSQAMDALREGMQNLGEALAQQEQGQQGQGEAQANRQGDRRDPLGRETGGDGSTGTDQNLLQGEDVYRRAQELLDEIRRRSAEAERPQEELDYLKRLLDRF